MNSVNLEHARSQQLMEMALKDLSKNEKSEVFTTHPGIERTIMGQLTKKNNNRAKKLQTVTNE